MEDAQIQAHNIELGLQIMAHHQEIYDVMEERLRQNAKFGPQNHPPMGWHAIMAEEMGEVAKEVVELSFSGKAADDYYKELKEAVAVGLAAMQNYNQRKKEGR